MTTITPAFNDTIVSVFDISMVTADMICLEVRDSKALKGNIVDYAGVSQGAYGDYVSKLNPVSGATEFGIVIGRNHDHIRFSDQQPLHALSRTPTDLASNYSGSSLGGRTVTNVYRISKPVDSIQQYGVGGSQILGVCMHHWIYLKLSGALSAGAGYTISNSGSPFPTITFDYSDRTTHCAAIRATQVGHRASDGEKLAYLSHWVPGFGTEGRIDYSAITSFEVIDASNATVFTSSAITRRITATDAETNLQFNTNDFYMPSTTIATKKITGWVGGTSTATLSAHGYVTGQVKMFRGMFDANLEGRPLKIGTTTANTFVIMEMDGVTRVATSNGFADLFATGFNNLVYDTFLGNRACTNVYQLDYSLWTSGVAGTYRIRVPGIGVSYPFLVGDDVHYKAAKVSVQGYYNQFLGIALDPAIGGVTRPLSYKDGVGGTQIFLSKLPAIASVETHNNDAINVTPDHGASAPFITTTRMTGWWIAWEDAGDWDEQLIVHAPSLWSLLEYGHEVLPTAVKNHHTFGFPRMTTLLDPTTYAGTDNLSEAVHMVVAYMDNYRRFQDPSGWVVSAVQYDDAGYGGGGNNRIPSFLSTTQPICLAGDHVSNYYYAMVAGKLGQIFRDAGFTTLGNLWVASAELAWDWAESINNDFLAHGTAGTVFNAYFGPSGLNLQANMGWSSATYTSAMQNCAIMIRADNADHVGIRGDASGMLYRATNNFAKYGQWLFNAFAMTTYVGMVEYVRATDLLTRPAVGGIRSGVDQIAYYVGTDTNGQGYDHAATSLFASAFAEGGQISSYKFGEVGVFFSAIGPDYMIRAFNAPQTTRNATNKFLRLIHSMTDYQQGSNQEGMCTTSGLGFFCTPNALHRDREAMGIPGKDWPGITTYTWWFSNQGGIGFFVFANGSDFNFTVNCPPVGVTNDPRLIEPYYRAYPAMQSHWATTFNIYNTEFTTETDIIPMYLANLWRWSWDGNLVGNGGGGSPPPGIQVHFRHKRV